MTIRRLITSLWIAALVPACTPPSITGPALKVPEHNFGPDAPSCKVAWKQTELSLMGWNAIDRGFLGAGHRNGALAVHYEVQYLPTGCAVELELLSNCHAEGKYEYQPQAVTDHTLVHNDSELFMRLPLGALKIQSELKGDRAFRADFMYVGIDALPRDAAYQMDDLKGPDCERATHVINRVYLGGFAWTFGESRVLDAAASLFSAGVGGKSGAQIGQVHTEGNANSCQKAQDEGTLNSGCQTPLHIGLLPIADAVIDRCKDVRRCTDRCDGGNAVSCYELGVLYDEGKSVAKNVVRAAELYLQACERGSAWGCIALARAHRSGVGVDRDPARAGSLLHEACDARHNSWGCFMLAEMYEAGEGNAADPNRAISYYDQACELGLADSCQREQLVLAPYCEQNNPRACVQLGALCERGAGGPIEGARAVTLYERACKAGEPTGCTRLGELYQRGTVGKVDRERAAQYFELACEQNHADGCFELGIAYENGSGVRKDLPRAVDLYNKACHGGLPMGCVYLGDMYRDGNGVKTDLDQAAQLFEGACSDEAAAACHRLAQMYENSDVAEYKARAAKFYKQACALGFAESCELAAQLAQQAK